MTRLPLLALLGLLSACSAGGERGERPDAGSGDMSCGPGKPEALPPGECRNGARWGAGQKAFREVTAEWGLEALEVQGTRLSVADLDGDGWPDLVVRRGGVDSDDFSPGGWRSTWVLRNDGNKVVDVTWASGLLATRTQADPNVGRPAEVWAFADVDNDGDVDVYTGIATDNASKTLGETSELLINHGDGTFFLAGAANPVRRAGEIDSPASASFVDFDRDGFVDLWVPQHGHSTATGFEFAQDRLWKGTGTGNFTDAVEAAGLVTEDWVDIPTINEARAHSRAWSGAACDLNGDGLPELLAASYGRAPNHLWQAEPREDGTVGYVNRSVASGYAYDADFGWQDNQFAACFCQANPTAQGCGPVAPPLISCTQQNWNHASDREPFRLGGNSGTTVCADLDSDGAIDLVTTEIKHWWAGSGSDGSEILLNTGERDARFLRPGRGPTGLVVPHETEGGWDEGIITAAVFDFDNDGRPDIYLGASEYAGNRGRLYHQTVEHLTFEPVPIADGIDHHRSHGVAIADFDRDGDEDIIVGHSRSRCDASSPANCYPTTQVRMFENLAGDESNWVQLDLEGCGGSNRSAIGARVTVAADGRMQTKEVGAGYGHYGQQDDRVLHFGLGAACEAEVTVRWPDAVQSAQVFKVNAGHRYKVRQGDQPRAHTR